MEISLISYAEINDLYSPGMMPGMTMVFRAGYWAAVPAGNTG